MGLFHDSAEDLRKQRLKELEDKRLRFAQRMQQEGFAPAHMLLASTERGGVIGLCRDGEEICLIVGPDFGGDGDFCLERYDRLPARREDFFQASEGMGGILGFGKRGATGFYLIVDRGGIELSIPFITNINAASEYRLAKNPLLSPKRRRGDANIVWDMQPIDKRRLPDLERSIDKIFGNPVR